MTVAGFSNNWATNLKLGSEFVVGPRNKEDNDGGEPPGYISVITRHPSSYWSLQFCVIIHYH